MLQPIQSAFPIATTMPLSFEAREPKTPGASFGQALMEALGEIDTVKKKAEVLDEKVFTLGEDVEYHNAVIADEEHSHLKKLFGSSLRTHRNLIQTIMNMQI